MVSRPEDRWEESPLPWMDLDVTVGPDGRFVDPIDRELACSFGRRWCLATGALPLGFDGPTLCLAVFEPPSPETRRLWAHFDPAPSLYRTSRAGWEAALARCFPDAEDGPQLPRRRRFGEWAVALGYVTPSEVDRYLAQQPKTGGRIGDILRAAGRLHGGQVADIVARQWDLGRVDLLGRSMPSDPELDAVWKTFPARFWRWHRVAPVLVDRHRLVVAMEDPEDRFALLSLRRQVRRTIIPVVAGPRDLDWVMDQRFGPADLASSRDRLEAQSPHLSARRVLTRPQAFVGLALGLALAASSAIFGIWPWIAATAAMTLLYGTLVGFRAWMVILATDREVVATVTPEEVAALSETPLPRYTVLIPVRDEAAVLPTLKQALERLDWPKDRLDVQLLIEADDEATRAAALATGFPSYVEVVTIPPADPRTKPKACNFGLERARGEFVTIFDAEDVPDPDQLKKAYLVFQRSGPDLACVQAKLTYFNRRQNLLTRWFTAEYAAWFDLYLPALYALDLPIPLGGTSNHFRRNVLEQIGAWDAYNVTEDADLGIRLYRSGYRTTIVNSYTQEEANSEFVNWVRQRSRWVKGYLQTWLVHMRTPRATLAELGWKRFLGMQAALLGTVLPLVFNPFFWALTTLWFLAPGSAIGRLFPPGIYYVGMLNLLAGNFLFAYLQAIGAARLEQWDLVEHSLTAPLYWGLMSLAAWKAVLQLIRHPSLWEKTQHGLSPEWTPEPLTGPLPPDPAALQPLPRMPG